MDLEPSSAIGRAVTVILLLSVIILALVFGAPGQGVRSDILERKIRRILSTKTQTYGLHLDSYDTTYRVILRADLNNMQEAVRLKNKLARELTSDEIDHLHLQLRVPDAGGTVSGLPWHEWEDIPSTITSAAMEYPADATSQE